ncbi:MAG: isopeptide-forming domain-containing fimbrial protein [Erysipelotrichales bacterium]|nr:isopeptide-forming domain-containing fimbrial protein [Erysipelotrichales bacterium]
MSKITGQLKYDAARSSNAYASLPGIANVPIVLQDKSSGAMLVILTDSNGNYEFDNVPNGSYQIVESYGMIPAVSSPGDFTNATIGAILNGGVTPPITFVANPPSGATNLDCTTPNTLLVTVLNADLTNQNILNGPVKYTPITTIMDNGVIVSTNNLIIDADNGTFGYFPPGTATQTTLPSNPYPGVGAGFTYVSSIGPHDGQFTIENITSPLASGYTWWSFADHTSGNETGRMMVINGYSPGAEIFNQTVTVNPNTDYLFSAWILNMIKVPGYANPALGVQLLDDTGQVILSETLGQFIPLNSLSPEWVQIGSIINSGNNTSINVQFISEGQAALGNDYAIDDILLVEVTLPKLSPVKSVDKTDVGVGDTVIYTIALQNKFANPITNVNFQDTLPDGLTFVPGSVTINGVTNSTLDPNVGFALQDINGGSTAIITFSAIVDKVPQTNPATNSATMTYDYSLIQGGIASTFNVSSNSVLVYIDYIADLCISKTANAFANSGDLLTYTITITNSGPSSATGVTLTDVVPASLQNVNVSVDNGTTWQTWSGTYVLGNILSQQTLTILIRGTINPAFIDGNIINTATVSSTVPQISTNASTTTTIMGPRFQAISNLIQSVALEEKALAKIIIAESKKLQMITSMKCATTDTLLSVNKSVSRLIENIASLEMILQSKLNLFQD